MPTYVIDKSVIDQINQGNFQLANVLLKILNSGNAVWMTAEAYREVTTPDRTYKTEPVRAADGSLQLSIRQDRVKNLRNANAEFLREAGIRSPLQDNYVERYDRKGMLDQFHYKDMRTAALAFHLDAELITMNDDFLSAWRKARGKVAPQLGEMQPVKGTIDYNRARRYFNLEPATIAGDQIVLTPAKPPAPSGKLVYADQGPGNPPVRIEPPQGPVTKTGARTVDMSKSTKREVGMPLKGPREVGGPNAGGEAAMIGGIFVLQGVNLLFKYQVESA